MRLLDKTLRGLHRNAAAQRLVQQNLEHQREASMAVAKARKEESEKFQMQVRKERKVHNGEIEEANKIAMQLRNDLSHERNERILDKKEHANALAKEKENTRRLVQEAVEETTIKLKSSAKENLKREQEKAKKAKVLLFQKRIQIRQKTQTFHTIKDISAHNKQERVRLARFARRFKQRHLDVAFQGWVCEHLERLRRRRLLKRFLLRRSKQALAVWQDKVEDRQFLRRFFLHRAQRIEKKRYKYGLHQWALFVLEMKKSVFSKFCTVQ